MKEPASVMYKCAGDDNDDDNDIDKNKKKNKNKNKKILILHTQMFLTSECSNTSTRWRRRGQ